VGSIRSALEMVYHKTVITGVQGNAEKLTKQLEAQLAELNAKLEQSAREIVELNSVKARTQAENAEHVRQIEEAESQLNELTRLKQTLGKQLEETKASLEEESRLRAKFQSEARNFQVSASTFISVAFFVFKNKRLQTGRAVPSLVRERDVASVPFSKYDVDICAFWYILTC